MPLNRKREFLSRSSIWRSLVNFVNLAKMNKTSGPINGNLWHFSTTKPKRFADCIGDELPVGWEKAYDPKIGVYYINHFEGRNQLIDPRDQYRCMQDAMIREYLESAKQSLNAKQQILDVREEKLKFAEAEYYQLHSRLGNGASSSHAGSSQHLQIQHQPVPSTSRMSCKSLRYH